MAAPARPDWQTDWLYAVVLRQAEEDWEWCSLDPDPDRNVWRYVLIEEWSSADDSMCSGKIVRAWVRDAKGLHEIGLGEYRKHKRRIRGRIYPFVLMSFHILADRKRIVLGHRQASTAGGGSRYLVVGEGDKARLEPDPSSGFWVS